AWGKGRGAWWWFAPWPTSAGWSPCASRTLERRTWLVYDGHAMAARIATTATAIINSINAKPRRRTQRPMAHMLGMRGTPRREPPDPRFAHAPHTRSQAFPYSTPTHRVRFQPRTDAFGHPAPRRGTDRP